jgi:transposase InsO family protein
MPWKTPIVSDLRLALVHSVRTLHRPVAVVAREFGVSRKTAFKWLRVFDRVGGGGDAGPLTDRSRRPATSPTRTEALIERAVLQARDQFNWGPRKIHAYLQQRSPELRERLPSARTVAAVLQRNGRVRAAAAPTPEFQRFERDAPNRLWQIDHKGPVEVDRKRVCPFTVLDDHSRWCLAFEPVPDKTMNVAWDVLWRVMGEVGMPEEVLADRAFGGLGTSRPVGISAFDAKLIRLGIRPLHGRPYHPQTQGKVEALHGSSVRELIDFNARRDSLEHFTQDCARWREIYNTLRPHESLGDRPPASRYRPSPRQRPATLPAVSYEPHAVLRIVCKEGLIRFRRARILLGRGLTGQLVRLEETEHELNVYYAWKRVRQLRLDEIAQDHVL